MHPDPEPRAGPIALITESDHHCVVVLHGDVDEPEHMELVALALGSGERSGKQIVVDLSQVGYTRIDLLYELLKPGHREGQWPWLCGPFSPHLRRLLEVTGTAGIFRIFPTLGDCTNAT